MKIHYAVLSLVLIGASNVNGSELIVASGSGKKGIEVRYIQLQGSKASESKLLTEEPGGRPSSLATLITFDGRQLLVLGSVDFSS